jgi:membrane-bound lytic murein transglycosylase D
MEKNAAEYGLDGVQLDAPLDYETIQAEAPTSLSLIADITDTPVAELAALNPAILRGPVPSGFELHVPKGSARQIIAALALVPPGRRDAWRMHRVAPGETAADIARRYGAAPSAILAANDIESGNTVEGDWVVIPAAPAPQAAARGVTAKPAARKAGSSKTAAFKAGSSRKSAFAAKTAAPKTAVAGKPAAKSARSASTRKPVKAPATRASN